jgi:hypothetical protein
VVLRAGLQKGVEEKDRMIGRYVESAMPRRPSDVICSRTSANRGGRKEERSGEGTLEGPRKYAFFLYFKM